MSIEAVKHAYTVPNLSPSEKAVLVCIAWHQNRDSGEAYAGTGTMATETSLNRRTVERAIKSLEKGGHLLVNRQKTAGGKWHTNRYTVANTSAVSVGTDSQKTGTDGTPVGTGTTPVGTGTRPIHGKGNKERKRAPLKPPHGGGENVVKIRRPRKRRAADETMQPGGTRARSLKQDLLDLTAYSDTLEDAAECAVHAGSKPNAEGTVFEYGQEAFEELAERGIPFEQAVAEATERLIAKGWREPTALEHEEPARGTKRIAC